MDFTLLESGVIENLGHARGDPNGLTGTHAMDAVPDNLIASPKCAADNCRAVI